MRIIEGKARIRIKKSEKISKEMEVFYNPVMKLNRDISVLLLNALDRKNMLIALPLAGSGVRGIRFLNELKKNVIGSICINDYDKKAVRSIKNNLKLNNMENFTAIKNIRNESKNVEKNGTNKKYQPLYNKIRIYNEDANLFLLNSRGFDYIDVDPFGSSNPYLDSAVRRISRHGILAVTNTDTAALTGTFPKVCMRKYWAAAKKNYMMHETGLRILIRKIQLVGMQYGKALIPIFSYFKNHYFRIFFKCIKGRKECDYIVKLHGMFNGSGPMWLGLLWDKKLANKMFLLEQKAINRNSFKNKSISTKIKKSDNNNLKIINNQNEVLMFLKIIKEESKVDAVGFFDTHNSKGKIMKKDILIKNIKNKGYSASETHFLGTGIRTDAKI
jgi:tRNA (guanine26-N2/guanine27-N2)-dimethyltransferase